ncbi:MAG: STAS domain-containing protein [Nitrospirales bacterium]|nr:STAS domain-containing protein [Nitrospirales bacterium]
MLQVREQIDHHTTVLALTGKLDRQSTIGVEALIMGAKEVGYQHVILDFSGVIAIDSVGLGQLFLWYHKMKPHHLRLSIVNPSACIRDVLELSHIPDIVPIYTSEQEAIRQKNPDCTP